MRQVSFQDSFQQSKLDARSATEQAYELARTAAAPGKKQYLTGALGADGNYHLSDQNSFLRMVAFVRMMEANDPVVGSAGQRLMANVNVGQMTPSPDTTSDTVDEHIKGLWTEYAADPEQCDAQRRMNYESQADVALVRTVFDGDILAVPEPDGSVLHMEAHRCQTPHRSRIDRGVCGIQSNGKRPDVYYLSGQSHPYGHVVKVSDVEPIKAYDTQGWKQVYHVFRPERFTLSRGITSLAPCGTAASRRDDNEFAALLKSQIASCVTYIEQVLDPQVMAQLMGSGYKQDDLAQPTFLQKDDAGFEMRTAQIHAGRVLSPRFGHKLEMQSPNVPGEGFFDLNYLMIQYLSMNLDLPLIVLLLDARDANFSSYRNVLDQARMSFGKIQRWFAAAYHRPRFRHFVRTRLRTVPTGSTSPAR